MIDPNSNNILKRAYQVQNPEKYRQAGKSSQNTASSRSPVAGTIRTVADLFEAVKRMDANFNPYSPSKVANDVGSPIVVCHGSDKGLTVFDLGLGCIGFRSRRTAHRYIRRNEFGDLIGTGNGHGKAPEKEIRQIDLCLCLEWNCIEERIIDGNKENSDLLTKKTVNNTCISMIRCAIICTKY